MKKSQQMEEIIFDGKFNANADLLWIAVDKFKAETPTPEVLSEITIVREKDTQIWLGATIGPSPWGRHEYLLGKILLTNSEVGTRIQLISNWEHFSIYFRELTVFLQKQKSLAFVRAPSVFISHSSIDKKFVLELADRLKEYNVKVWLDQEEIYGGDSLIDKIGRAISETDFVIAVLSSNSVKSNWVQKELNIALVKEIEDKRIRVLPILLEKVEIPIALRDKHYIDFSDESGFDFSFSRLLKALGLKNERWGSRLVIPGWEDAVYRFLQGRGELVLGKDGPACNIFEAAIYFEDDDFPLIIGTKPYSRDELLLRIYSMLYEYPYTGSVPDLYNLGTNRDLKDKLWKLMREKFEFARPEAL